MVELAICPIALNRKMHCSKLRWRRRALGRRRPRSSKPASFARSSQTSISSMSSPRTSTAIPTARSTTSCPGPTPSAPALKETPLTVFLASALVLGGASGTGSTRALVRPACDCLTRCKLRHHPRWTVTKRGTSIAILFSQRSRMREVIFREGNKVPRVLEVAQRLSDLDLPQTSPRRRAHPARASAVTRSLSPQLCWGD